MKNSKISKDFKLTLLGVVFVLGLVLANILAVRIVDVGGFVFSMGTIVYALTFLTSDAISEVFGKKKVKQLIFIAVFSQIITFFFFYLALTLPSNDSSFDESFKMVFGLSLRIIFASIITFLISQVHDLWAFHYWRKKFSGKHLWLRNNFSTIVSQIIDTTLFTLIAFFGVWSTTEIIQIILFDWVFKIFLSIIDTPILYGLVAWLKKEEE